MADNLDVGDNKLSDEEGVRIDIPSEEGDTSQSHAMVSNIVDSLISDTLNRLCDVNQQSVRQDNTQDHPSNVTQDDTPDQPSDVTQDDTPSLPSNVTPDQPSDVTQDDTPNLPSNVTPDQPSNVTQDDTPDLPSNVTQNDTPDQPSDVTQELTSSDQVKEEGTNIFSLFHVYGLHLYGSYQCTIDVFLY